MVSLTSNSEIPAQHVPTDLWVNMLGPLLPVLYEVHLEVTKENITPSHPRLLHLAQLNMLALLLDDIATQYVPQDPGGPPLPPVHPLQLLRLAAQPHEKLSSASATSYSKPAATLSSLWHKLSRFLPSPTPGFLCSSSSTHPLDFSSHSCQQSYAPAGKGVL